MRGKERRGGEGRVLERLMASNMAGGPRDMTPEMVREALHAGSRSPRQRRAVLLLTEELDDGPGAERDAGPRALKALMDDERISATQMLATLRDAGSLHGGALAWLEGQAQDAADHGERAGRGARQRARHGRRPTAPVRREGRHG